MSPSQELMTMTGTEVCGYRLTNIIGAGAFGAVYKGVAGQDAIAIKISMNRNAWLVEAETLQSLYYSDVVPKVHFTTQTGSYHAIGLELMGFDLETLRDKMPWKAFKKPTLAKLAFQATQCLQAIHAKKIIHRDIKLGNIAVTIPSTPNHRVMIRLLDFGHATVYSDNNGNLLEDGRNLDFSKCRYAAHDVQLGLNPTPKDDFVMLSYGIINGSGFDITQKLSLPSEELMSWKHELLRNPSDSLPGLLKWMSPWYKEIGYLDDILAINYGVLKMKIQESIEDYDVRADLFLEMEDGEPVLV
ncbi:hypothetical protein L5515_019025 [Caenorhabditis briggsae]|nr:hypothetical protein L5515_019025 [Caenorhabditis briggsae]